MKDKKKETIIVAYRPSYNAFLVLPFMSKCKKSRFAYSLNLKSNELYMNKQLKQSFAILLICYRLSMVRFRLESAAIWAPACERAETVDQHLFHQSIHKSNFYLRRLHFNQYIILCFTLKNTLT